MIDTNINCIKQVTTLLVYQEPQILEVFRNPLLTKLYWVLFPRMHLRQEVEMVKIILMKEKMDRQLAGQISSILFCYVRQCQFISDLLLVLSRGIVSCILLITLSATAITQHSSLGSTSLCTLRQNRRNDVTKAYNYNPLLSLHFSILTIP